MKKKLIYIGIFASLLVSCTESLEDKAAREAWGWKPAYDLESMTVDMLEKLREKLK